MDLKQVALDQWPAAVSEEAMLIALTVDQIALKNGIEFTEELDDLDHYDAAVISFGGNKIVALQAYRNAPSGGTNILSKPNAANDLIPLIDLLNLDASDVLWIAPWAEPTVKKTLARLSRSRLAA